MAGELVVIGAAILGAIALMLRSASASFDPSDDDEEDAEVEVATGDNHGHSSGGGSGGGKLEGTVKATLSSRPNGGDVKVSTHSPLEQPHTRGRGRKSRVRKSTSCQHCGAVNKDQESRCWSCGSSPQANFSSDSIESVNKRLQDAAADDSYFVKKGDEPRDHPVESPAIPSEDDEDDPYENKSTDEDDIQDREDIPFYWTWLGLFFGWINKWRTLTNTHMRSMSVVAGITCLFWGVSVIYGTFQYGTSGLVALIGASMIAVVSGAIATLFYLAPGRVKTAAVTHPFAINTVFLPLTVIALNEPAFDGFLYDSALFAEFIIRTFLAPLGLEAFFRNTFNLSGSNYLLMWFALSLPLGWTLGTSSYMFDVAAAKIGDLHQSRQAGAMEDAGGAPQPGQGGGDGSE